MQATSVQQPLRTYSFGAHGPVRSMAFFPDGGRIVTGGHRDSTARIWDLGTGNEDGQPLRGHTLPTLCVAVSKGGSEVVTGGEDNQVFLWDVNNRNAARVLFSPPTSGRILSVAFNSTTTSPMLVASSGSDGVVNIWKVKPDMDFTPLKRIPLPNTIASSIQFSLGYPNLIAVTSLDKKARIYDAHSGEQKAIFDGQKSAVLSLMWFPDGQRLAAGGDKTIRIWDTSSKGSKEEILLGHSQLVKSVSVSPQGRFVASGSNDRTLRFWNAITRAQIGSPISHPGPVNLAVFSPDGKSLVSVTENSDVYLWDTNYLEVEEGLQRAEGVLDGLVSFSSAMRAELRQVLEAEFDNIRHEHAREIAEQRQMFEDKMADDERRFSQLQDAITDVKETQDDQFFALNEALHAAATKQETQYEALRDAIREVAVKQDNDVQALQRGIKRVVEKHESEFQELKNAQNASASKHDAKFEDIQKDLHALHKLVGEMGGYMKKAFPQPRS